MQTGLDLGEEVLSRVWDRLDRSEHVSEWNRGFTWRPDGVTQHLWSDRPVTQQSAPRWRVQVRSCLLRGFDGSSAQLDALRTELSNRTLGALVRSADERSRLQLATTFHVHHGNAQLATRLIAMVAQFHIAEVRRLARSERLVTTGVVPDVTAPATAVGPSASVADGPLGTAFRFSPAAGPSMTRALEALRAHDGVRAVPTPRGLLASVPCLPGDPAPRRALFEVGPSASGAIGPGMRMVLSLPGYANPLAAVTLNEEELSIHARTDLLGCWWAVDHVLRHVSFIPMGLCAAELMSDLSVGAVARAQWASTLAPVRDAWMEAPRPPGRILQFPRAD
jgi:hypothetical protein